MSRVIQPTFDDWISLGQTLWGEARNQPFEGQVAVAWVPTNRVRLGWYPSVQAACEAPAQFSCWNRGDPNREPMRALTQQDPLFRRALGIAALVLSGDLPDFSRGATNYYRWNMHPEPEWVPRCIETVVIGAHRFMREKEARR